MTMAEVMRISDGCITVEYVPLEGRSIEEVREELASDPEVHAVDVPVTDVLPLGFPHDSSHEQWHLEVIHADKLWDGSESGEYPYVTGWPSGAEVVVAVIDDGVDGTHRDLNDNVDTTVDRCHWTGLVVDDEIHDHGTHVAGIAAAERNSQDGVGVAPEARILPIRLLGPGRCVSTTAEAVALAIRTGALM